MYFCHNSASAREWEPERVLLRVRACLRVCACKCTSAFVYVCLLVCVHAYANECACVCAPAQTRVHVCARLCKQASVYAFMCAHACLCVSVWVREHLRKLVSLRACVLLRKHASLRIRVCTPACACAPARPRFRMQACMCFVHACRFVCFCVGARLLFCGILGWKQKV